TQCKDNKLTKKCMAISDFIRLRKLGNLKTMTIIEVVGTSINLFCSILFVLYVFDDGAFARLLAISLSYVFKAAAYILLLLKFRLLKLRISFRLIKSSVSYSLPLLPNSIALWLIRTFDRVLVSYFCGPAICGEYSVGVQISFVVYFIQDSVMQALGPLQIQSFIDDKIAALKRLFSLSHMLWLMMGFMTFLYCTVVPELMNIFLDHKFVPNYLTVIFLTCVYIFQAQYRLFFRCTQFS
ncbi:oligosaccharide flippase family protein, partial [Bacteroides uniformis]